MSTFRRDVTITLDGTPYKVQTRAGDQMSAEVMMVKSDGATPDQRPVAMGFRVSYQAFRRCYPDHELAGSFTRWLDVLDDLEGIGEDGTDAGADDETPGMLDPTLEVASAASP
jgi:hypothetical protein